MTRNSERKGLKSKISIDVLGIIASSICLIHCLTVPLLVLVLPAVGLRFLEADWTHKALALFVFTFALWAVLPNYFKHRKKEVLLAMLSGLTLVFFATFFTESLLDRSWEMPLITAGNMIIVITHLRNRKICAHDLHDT